MKITAYKSRPNISENTEERIEIELSDEEILRIGKMYFELASNPVNNMTSAIDMIEKNRRARQSMSDLISQQAAIDAIEKNAYRHTYLDQIVDIIKALPSAEPEVIRCKDCDWWEKQKNSVQGRCEKMQMYPAGGWYCGNARRRENNEA